MIYNGIFGLGSVPTQTMVGAGYRAATSTGQRVWRVSSQFAQPEEDWDWDLSMGDDQLLGTSGR